MYYLVCQKTFNPLNAELNTFCHFLTLLRNHHILHFSRIRVNSLWNFTEEIKQRRTHLKTPTTEWFSCKCSTFIDPHVNAMAGIFPHRQLTRLLIRFLSSNSWISLFRRYICTNWNKRFPRTSDEKKKLIIVKCVICFHTDPHSVNFDRHGAILQILCFLHLAF